MAVRAIAEAMGVKRQAVYQWLGGDIPLDRLGPLSDALGQPIVIRIGAPDSRASWPEWAQALDAKLDALVSDAALAEALHEARRTDARRAGDADPPRTPGSPSGER